MKRDVLWIERTRENSTEWKWESCKVYRVVVSPIETDHKWCRDAAEIGRRRTVEQEKIASEVWRTTRRDKI